MKGHFRNQIHKISQKCDFPSVKVISGTYTSQNVTVPTVHRILHAGVCMHSMTSLPWAESPMLWTLGHHRHHLSESLRPDKIVVDYCSIDRLIHGVDHKSVWCVHTQDRWIRLPLSSIEFNCVCANFHVRYMPVKFLPQLSKQLITRHVHLSVSL